MKIRTIMRHFKESFKSIGRNGWMTFASVSAVTVTLLLVGVFALIMLNLNGIATNLENDVEMKLIIDSKASVEEEQAMIADLKANKNIETVLYSSKEEELAKVIKDYGDEFALQEQNNPLNNAIYVKAKNPQETASLAKEMEKYTLITEVHYGKGKVEKLFTVVNKARDFGLILVGALLAVAVFLIFNTIRITILARGEEIEIMKLVGAKNHFVRIPFLLEGAWLGLLGSILPILVIVIGYNKLYNMAAPRLKGELLQLQAMNPMVYEVIIGLTLLGIVIGMLGSFMSVRKFLKI